MSFDIRIINPMTHAGWDEAVRSFPEGSFFHSAGWARVLEQSYGYRPLYFTIYEGEKIAGILPVMEVNSRLTGRRGVSLPFTDFCQPIARDPLSFRALLEAAVEYGRRRGWQYLEIRGGEEELANRPAWARFFGHTLALERGERALYLGLRDSNRRNIRRAQMAGIEVIFCESAEAVEEFFRLNQMTRKDHGLPIQPRGFFRTLHEHIIAAGLGRVVLALNDGQAVAGAVFLLFGRKAFFKYGASDRKFKHLRPNNILLWEAIRRLANDGFSTLCLGRTEPEHAGLRQFKQGWGAEETRVHYYRYDFKKEAFCPGRFRSPAASLGTRLFSRMPIPVLNVFGSLLYRHMG